MLTSVIDQIETSVYPSEVTRAIIYAYLYRVEWFSNYTEAEAFVKDPSALAYVSLCRSIARAALPGSLGTVQQNFKGLAELVAINRVPHQTLGDAHPFR